METNTTTGHGPNDEPVPTPTAAKQKISEWLGECGSHEIYSLVFIANDYTKCTGLAWPDYVATHTRRDTERAIRARGLGGSLAAGEPYERMVWAYEMAANFARNLCDFTSTKMGRGSSFYECIAALAKAGL